MTRVNLSEQHPAAYEAMIALNAAATAAAQAAGLDAKLVELVKIRASQINGCAFCLRMHTRDAIEVGETADRLSVVAAWWESQYFSDQERAALALTEEITRLPVPARHDWDDGSLDDAQISAVSWLAIVINSWNRIAITSHSPVAP